VQPWLPAGPFAQVPTQLGIGTVVPAEQIQMVKYPHPFFRWTGYSVLYAIANQNDVARLMDSSRSTAFATGIDPTFMLSIENPALDPDDEQLRRWQQQFVNVYGGPQAAGKPFIAPPFTKLERVSNTPIEMGYVEGWNQLLDFTLAAFGLNRAVAFMSADSNFATMHASIANVYHATVDPLLAKFSNILTNKVIHPWYSHEIHLHLHGRRLADDEMDMKKIDVAARNKAIKIGEIREKLGLPPSDRDQEWVGQHDEELQQEQAQQQQNSVPGMGGMPGMSGQGQGGGRQGQNGEQGGKLDLSALGIGPDETSDTMGEALGNGEKKRAEQRQRETVQKAFDRRQRERSEKKFNRQQEILETLRRRGTAKEWHANGKVTVPTT
jgi:hypothetical protein